MAKIISGSLPNAYLATISDGQTTSTDGSLSMVAHWLGLDREHGNSTTPLLVGDQDAANRLIASNILPPRTAGILHRQHRFQQAPGYGVGFAPLGACKHRRVRSPSAIRTKVTWKHILQKRMSVLTAAPIRRANRNLRRYATFIATSNNFNILTDPTGEPTFLICIEVSRHHRFYTTGSTTSSCMHRRWKLLANGERYWLQHEEETEIVANNRQSPANTARRTTVPAIFPTPEKNEVGEFLLSIEILGRIKQKQRDFSYTKTVISNFGRLFEAKRHSFEKEATEVLYIR